ncbi:hypothetical protein FKP32DRAFT_530230 [Trametes sanguinea]|nr:hypothetical protein FKP32DRAFT_530230 [Trametes sanguinea]
MMYTCQTVLYPPDEHASGVKSMLLTCCLSFVDEPAACMTMGHGARSSLHGGGRDSDRRVESARRSVRSLPPLASAAIEGADTCCSSTRSVTWNFSDDDHGHSLQAFIDPHLAACRTASVTPEVPDRPTQNNSSFHSHHHAFARSCSWLSADLTIATV